MFKIFLALLSILSISFAAAISSYKAVNGCIEDKDGIKVAIREVTADNKTYYLSVNPQTLVTKFIISNSKPAICPKSIYNSQYYRLLNSSYSNTKHPLHNDGIVAASSGIFLTTDLCPSSKSGFEERLYKGVISHFKNPVPITLFITSKWIDKHKKEFLELKQWQVDNNLSITWGNHTALHIYHPKAPLEHNFVLSPEEKLSKDILSLELTLIKNGITPSIFFRFPGLVSNKDAIKRVKELGLVTIGTNAWLAINPRVKDGSIILVHGNKNEPKGVDILLKLIEDGNITKLNDIKTLKLDNIEKN